MYNSKRLISIIAAAVSATADHRRWNRRRPGRTVARTGRPRHPDRTGARRPVVAIPVGPCQLAAQLNPGANIVTGGPANDALNGGPGVDIIDGRGGNDILRGFGGDDVLAAAPAPT